MEEREGRQAGIAMLAGTAGSLLLMLHHPTSLKGQDDGLLLGDWSNAGVHGGMILCLMAIRLGAASVPGRLGRARVSVRAAQLAFDAGMGALIVAALINGFATGQTPRPDLSTLFALNRTFAVFGMVMIAGALALWAVPMLRQGGLLKGAACVGLAAALLACGWVIHGGGAFGLIPATVAAGVFAAWSVLTAADLLRGSSGVTA